MNTESQNSYAGDLSPADAWALLETQPAAVLVDVRTAAEWSFVGVADISALARQPVFLEWQVWPSMTVDVAFAEKLDRMLAKSSLGKETPIVFLCRSGVRSQYAAIEMTAAGWTACYNLKGGFEGPPDAERHRGLVSGWKASGLPWTQS